MSKISLEKPKRSFVSEELKIQKWEDIAEYYEALLSRKIDTAEQVEQWLKDSTELDSVIGEDYRWRYVKQSLDTESEAIKQSYLDFTQNIMPHLSKVKNDLEQKLYNSKAFNQLDENRFYIFKRGLKNSLELFRAENIPIQTELMVKEREYASLIGSLTVNHKDKEYTIQQAAALLEGPDRSERKVVYEKINKQYLKSKEELNNIFDDLIKKRHQLALNAGFDNYRDYKLQALGRFDYGVKECEQFHHAVKEVIVPFLNTSNTNRKKALNYDTLRPFDLSVDFRGDKPLEPFKNEEELIEKTFNSLNQTDSYFGESLMVLKSLGHLDLMSRKGKAPGGYNMPLPEIGIPFIFMNGVGTVKDVRTLIHEAGHAVHSIITKNLPYSEDKEFTSEVAELASMSMEMFTLDKYDNFFEEAENKRAVLDYLDKTIGMIPWIALIDKFQHWIYTNVEHTAQEREDKWVEMYNQFSSNVTDWKGYEDVKAVLWQKQLHLFQVPFYYIEYGIAQLGALAMWRNYKANPSKTIKEYKAALSLGYMKSIPEIYETGGIKFDFSKAYVQELVNFVEEEIQKMN